MTESKRVDPFGDAIMDHRFTFEAVDCAIEYADCGTHRLAITVSFAWKSEWEAFLATVEKFKAELNE